MAPLTTAAGAPAISYAGLTAQQAAQVQSMTATQGGDGAAHRYVRPGTPPATATIQQLLVTGSYGDVTYAGTTPRIDVPDGPGFGGVTGYVQGPADWARNSYSVLDANFFGALGVLKDQATGQARSFTSQMQAYNAAGYISVFHPDLYVRMIAAQDSGQGTILGMSLAVLGVTGAPADPGLAAAGLQANMLAGEQVPGGTQLARDTVMSAIDMSGGQWTQPHHAEASWRIYARLIESGVSQSEAAALSGEAAVSGAGQLNGLAEQVGPTGMTEAEVAVFRRAAELEQRTGIPALFIIGGSHNHAAIDPNARSEPRINAMLGLAATDRSASAERLAAIKRVLLDGSLGAAAVGTTGSGGASQALSGAVPVSLESALTALSAAVAQLVEAVAQLAAMLRPRA